MADVLITYIRLFILQLAKLRKFDKLYVSLTILPDAAIMIVELVSREDAYEQNWHIPAPGVITGHL